MKLHELRVLAVKGYLPLADRDGRIQMGRAVGRARGEAPTFHLTADGEPHPALPEGEWVPDTAYYRRAIADGSLTLAEER